MCENIKQFERKFFFIIGNLVHDFCTNVNNLKRNTIVNDMIFSLMETR